MRKPCFLERIRIRGGWGEAPTTTYTVLFSGQGGFSSPCLAPATRGGLTPLRRRPGSCGGW